MNTNSSESRVQQLLLEAKRGDSGALGELFGLYQNYIGLLAATQVRSRLRLRASASDIVQETFLNAHRGFAEFRGRSAAEFVAWLRTILARRIQFVYQQHLDAQVRDVRREVSLEAVGLQVEVTVRWRSPRG